MPLAGAIVWTTFDGSGGCHGTAAEGLHVCLDASSLGFLVPKLPQLFWAYLSGRQGVRPVALMQSSLALCWNSVAKAAQKSCGGCCWKVNKPSGIGCFTAPHWIFLGIRHSGMLAGFPKVQSGHLLLHGLWRQADLHGWSARTVWSIWNLFWLFLHVLAGNLPVRANSRSCASVHPNWAQIWACCKSLCNWLKSPVMNLLPRRPRTSCWVMRSRIESAWLRTGTVSAPLAGP